MVFPVPPSGHLLTHHLIALTFLPISLSSTLFLLDSTTISSPSLVRNPLASRPF